VKRAARVGGASLCLAVALALAAAVHLQDSRRAPDWSAPYRWVHIDNLDAAKAPVFEDARRKWLAALHREKGTLDDGRMLFWHSKSGDPQTFFTFYPFTKYADLDARRATALQTNELAGKEAVDAYRAGDVALVPPHRTEVWQRDPDFDFAAPGNEKLDEATANAGRIEMQQEDLQRGERIAELWKQMRDALAQQRYPLVCRAFRSAFGSGQIVRMWMARDAETLRSAPSLDTAIAATLGEAKGKALLAEWTALHATQKAYAIERRADLSNLP